MQHSAEVRWFFAGVLSRDVTDWFCAGEPRTQEPEREDRYLRLPSTHVGVKFREKNFEIKALVEDFGIAMWAGNVSGGVQRWVKWSCKEPEVENLLAALTQNADGSFVNTTKKRLVRKYSLDSGSIQEVDAKTARPDNGCNVELTRITTNEKDYWSFGFESFEFGPGTRALRVKEFLDIAVAAFFTDRTSGGNAQIRLPAGVSLMPQNSFSYPQWLGTVT